MSDQIDINQLSNALQAKVDLPIGKSQAEIDYVVDWQTPTAANNYSWYRLYKSGWIEQGGHYTHDNVEKTVTTDLIKTMANTHYNLQITKEIGTAAAYDTNYQYISSYVNNSKTTTSFQVRMTTNNRLNGYDWLVKGFAAIT